MTILVNYQKRKNLNLFNKFQSNSKLNLIDTQNYIPIYSRFFSVNNTNWNSINLNHKYYICDIKDIKVSDTTETNENIFNCKVKTYAESNEEVSYSKKVFIKLAPLLDPFKYLVGKYDHKNPQLFNLPSLNHNVFPKISDPNNSSYIDGFFSFLTSKALHEFNFIHGLDYYGSFLAIKNNYKINIIDDIDYLIQSEFFNKHKNVLFSVEDYEDNLEDNNKITLKPIKISTSIKSVSSIKSLDNNIFENIFEDNIISLNDIKTMNVDLVDVTTTNLFDITTQPKCETLMSKSSCSSRTSHTDEEADALLCDTDIIDETCEVKTDDDESEWESVPTNCSYDNDETIMLTFPKFPVQVICMENCEDTLDNLILNRMLTEEEWFSALMQIIMILITYQKMFSFTHNDLHTNNIMYIPTDKKFIYYIYKKNVYKVPTFGKIYKLIDFGRAIYKFDGKIFCSDSFQNGGDAATQYNTEPFFNDKKPRLDPNFSFDLCRLACSIFDYVVDDFEQTKNLEKCSPLVRLIIEWCIDDNGINVLYKNSGIERYPDFKLYKMIARYVHNHTPQLQLQRKEFSKFLTQHKNIQKNEYIINIDELPSYA
jgi:hypothetical protein